MDVPIAMPLVPILWGGLAVGGILMDHWQPWISLAICHIASLLLTMSAVLLVASESFSVVEHLTDYASLSLGPAVVAFLVLSAVALYGSVRMAWRQSEA